MTNLREFLSDYCQHIGTPATIRIAAQDGEDNAQYLYIKPDQLDLYIRTVDENIHFETWSTSVFNVTKEDVYGNKYETYELIVTLELY